MDKLIRPEAVEIEDSWKGKLKEEFEKEYFSRIKAALLQERKLGFTFYPPGPEIFSAFNLCPFEKCKVIILGQDPYHGTDQAHGLSFSVRKGVRLPPSLKNIYSELQKDVACSLSGSGELTPWAKQGVLLLNSSLTVQAGKAGSHQHLGWQLFTDAAIEVVSKQKEHCVFILWGRWAQQKAELIDKSRHLVLESPHPSPFSANQGFFGSKPFSKANAYLEAHGQKRIDWSC